MEEGGGAGGSGLVKAIRRMSGWAQLHSQGEIRDSTKLDIFPHFYTNTNFYLLSSCWNTCCLDEGRSTSPMSCFLVT